MKRDITCIGCPRGCAVTVEFEDGKVLSVTGNRCGRGEAYARNEVLNPVRVVTGLVRIAGVATPLSVKTSSPIPKDKIDACLDEIRAAIVKPPVAIGDVIIKDVCGLGVDVVATRELRGRDN